MGKCVAKRQLRNGYSQKNNVLDKVGVNGLYTRNKSKSLSNNVNSSKYVRKENKKKTKIKEKYLIKIAIQSISVIAIFGFIIAVKLLNIDVIKKLKVTEILKHEFGKNYSYSDIKNKTKNVANVVYNTISPIIPEKITQKTVAVFSNMFNNIKDYGNEKIEIYSEVQIYQEKKDISDGITLEVISTNVTEEDEITTILNSGVIFVKPTKGIITSNFGDREEIFAGTGNYHYGVDIANSKGSEIIASTDGIVITCDENNYFVKYVEIQNEDIITRYCHLDKIVTTKGEHVTHGTKIGEMGMSGQATGYHLHFEILYNGKRVNPQKILTLE